MPEPLLPPHFGKLRAIGRLGLAEYAAQALQGVLRLPKYALQALQGVLRPPECTLQALQEPRRRTASGAPRFLRAAAGDMLPSRAIRHTSAPEVRLLARSPSALPAEVGWPSAAERTLPVRSRYSRRLRRARHQIGPLQTWSIALCKPGKHLAPLRSQTGLPQPQWFCLCWMPGIPAQTPPRWRGQGGPGVRWERRQGLRGLAAPHSMPCARFPLGWLERERGYCIQLGR